MLDLLADVLIICAIAVVVNLLTNWVMGRQFVKNYLARKRAEKLGITLEELAKAEKELKEVEAELDKEMKVIDRLCKRLKKCDDF